MDLQCLSGTITRATLVGLALCGCAPSATLPVGESQWPQIAPQWEAYDGSGDGQVGQKVDAFLFPDQTGALVDFRQFLGFVTVLDLGATWCGPCQTAAAESQELQDTLQAEGPVWLMHVLLQDVTSGPPDSADASEWAALFGLQFPVLADEFQTLESSWSVFTWPTVLVVAPDGTIVERFDGPVPAQDVTEAVLLTLETYAEDLRE